LLNENKKTIVFVNKRLLRRSFFQGLILFPVWTICPRDAFALWTQLV